MAPQGYRWLAVGVLGIHLGYITLVIFGALVTRGRPRLAWLHVATLLYGTVVEVLRLWCPLTVAENWLEARAGVVPYRGPFLLHYLDAIVYPVIPPNLLTVAAAFVFVVNLGIYARRYQRRHSLA